MAGAAASPTNNSATHREVAAAKRERLTFTTPMEIAKSTPDTVEWIATGIAARGAITEIVAPPKMGKTTFVLNTIACLQAGSEFLGQRTENTSVVYLTEQPISSFRPSLSRAQLLHTDRVSILTIRECFGMEWPAIVREVEQEASRIDAGLVVVDTLHPFSGIEDENHSGQARDAMLPLQMMAQNLNGAVIVIRHERKGGGAVTEAGRGSSAFAGAVDVIISLRLPTGSELPHVRELVCVSRFEETLDRGRIALDGTRYRVVSGDETVARQEARDRLLAALPQTEDAAKKLETWADSAETKRSLAQSIVKQWSETDSSPISVVGAGRRGSPYRYFRAPQTHHGRSLSAMNPVHWAAEESSDAAGEPPVGNA